jgi:transient receptor potential cation channel subfamily A protein 1
MSSLKANALDCIKNKNLTLFSDIVNEQDAEAAKNEFPLPEGHWMNKPLSDEDDKTLLMVAIEENLHEYIEVLLQAGANASLFNAELGKAPVHTAAASGDLRSLKLLFMSTRNSADINSIVRASGRTALHICAEKGKASCLEYLLSMPNVEVNVPDKKGGGTPLYLAAKKGNRLMVEALVAAGADYNVKCFGKTVAEHIQDKIPDLDPASIKRTRAPLANSAGSANSGKLAEASATFRRLVEIIDNAAVHDGVSQDDLDEFKSILLEVDNSVLNRSLPGGYTLFQKSCDAGLADLAEVLLNEGEVDPNGVTDTAKIAPVLMAANRGHGKILELLFHFKADFTVSTGGSRETVLHCMLKHGRDHRARYKEALEFVLTKEELTTDIQKIVNRRDELQNTALHYATQMWSQDIVRRLLEAGANIGMKNHFDEVPITKIQPDTMEDFLDEYCLTSEGDVHHEDFELTFKYSFLAPPKEDLPTHASGLRSAVSPYAVVGDSESQKLTADAADKVALPETQSLWYMAQSKEHRHLLKHPVVTSFLHIKWDRIRRHFNRNLRFYSLFVFLLTWYTFEEFGADDLKPEGGGAITFWYALYCVLVILLLLFIVRDFALDIKDLRKADQINKGGIGGKHVCFAIFSNWLEVLLAAFMIGILIGGKQVLWYALVTLLCLLTMRELFQLAVSVKRYLLSPENLIEATVMILLAIILFVKDENIERDLKRIFAAYAIVLSWSELIVLIGKHPKLSHLNVYATMFFKVLGSFTLFLSWYAPFIVAFAIGFYIMLHTNGEGDFPFFQSPWLALVKTSTMFVGELEFSDLPIQHDIVHGPLGYIFLLFFVFIIVVVLMNLLNGLAVSDTGVIQGRDSPIFLQYFYIFSIFFLNRF